MKIKCKQKFHSIGQGLFYSCSVHVNDNNVTNVIFDCGSEKVEKVNEEIDKFNNNDIDVLVISHLHFDHVSGLDHLLKTRRVRYIILPYLTLTERILIQLLNQNKPEWYNEFLSSPYSYLNEKENIGNIITINGSDDNDDYSESSPEEITPLKDNLINNNRDVNVKLEEVDKKIKSIIQTEENIQFSGKLSLKKDRGYITINSLIMYLTFFYHKIDNKIIDDFYSEINKLKITDTESALASILNDEKRELLTKCYKKINKDINITSLAAYQAFILPFEKRKHSVSICSFNSSQYDFFKNLLCCNCDGFIDGRFYGSFIKDYKYKFYYDCFYDCHKHYNCLSILGNLLLGDIKLHYSNKKQKEQEEQKDIFTHFKNHLSSVKLVQLSHHGAENGWTDKLIKEIPPNSQYIASHGRNNKYCHPDRKVIMDLAENNRQFISVTEENEYCNGVEFDIKFNNKN